MQRANAASFGQAAAAYERGRPAYPPAALDWLLPPDARRVLDLGAGTGKLTRMLSARGLDVGAVEPSDGMRAQLAAALPHVPALAGTAEQMPLQDSSFDCVLVAQAWHWVDEDLALPEVARVLRPGGRLGLVWNLRDESIDWVAELGKILRPAGATTGSMAVQDLGRLFGTVDRFVVRWIFSMSHADLLDMVESRSYVITAPGPQRTALLEQVRELAGSHPDLVGRERIEMPYLTECFRADLRLT